MDSIVFYQPQLATAPKFNEKLVLPLATIPRNNARSALLQNGEWNPSRRDQGWLTYPDATDLCWRGQPRLGHQADGDNPLVDQENFLPSKLLPTKLNLGSITKNPVGNTPGGRNPASTYESRVGTSQYDPIELNDDNVESESTLDATTPCDPTRGLIGDKFDFSTQRLLSTCTAVNGSNDGVADDQYPLPNVGDIGELVAALPSDSTCGLISDGFDLATQLLLFNRRAVNDSNDGVANDKCLLSTKRKKSISSCSNLILNCDGPYEREDYVFDVIAADDEDGADAQPAKQRKLPDFLYRYPSPAGAISKIPEGEIDQTQSPIEAVAAIQQSDLRSGHGSYPEGIAGSDSNKSLRPPIIDLEGTADGVSTGSESTDVGDPQPGDSWEIRNIIGTKKVDGIEYYWVDWEPTWMCESELEGARELVDEFKARLQLLRRNKDVHGETGAAGEAKPKRWRGRPSKKK